MMDTKEAAEFVLARHVAGTFCCSADRGPCSAIDQQECGKRSCVVCAREPFRHAKAMWPCPPVVLACATLGLDPDQLCTAYACRRTPAHHDDFHQALD